jgi:hypothetical protein
MSNQVKGIQIEGLEELQKAFKGLPAELEASVIRNVARKPANRIVSLARQMFTPKDTGKTKRSIAILRVKDLKQRFIEIGIKGRSLAYIYFFGGGERYKYSTGTSTGKIKPTGNVVEKAADQLASSITKEFQVDITKVIEKGLKKYLKK